MAEEKSNDKAKQNTDKTANEDVEKNKGLGIISYLGILWIVPLLAAKDSKFAMYHANQGLNLFILSVGVSIIWIIPLLGWIVGFFGWIFVLILAITGIINAANGRQKELPVIGSWQLLK